MAKVLRGGLVVVGTVGGFGLSPARAQDAVPGHLVVKVAANVSAAQVARDWGALPDDRVPGTDVWGWRVPLGTDLEALARAVSKDRRVVYAEPDWRFEAPEQAHGDPFHFPTERGLAVAAFQSQAAISQVGAPPAPVSLSGPHAVRVAVLDTGVDRNHPLLRGRLVPGYNALSPGKAPVEFHDGVVGGAYGHGTMVAGIVAWIAPTAEILPVRVLDADGRGSLLQLAKGVEFALAAGARVLQCSLGTRAQSAALNEALDRAEAMGVVVVGSAGNSGSDEGTYPARNRGAIGVASVGAGDLKSDFSNYGSWVRLCAPGEDICSAYPGGRYARWSGTSFAAPFVSAAAAVVLSRRPDLTADMVRSLLRSTARKIDGVNPAFKGKLGKGVVDLAAAVASLR